MLTNKEYPTTIHINDIMLEADFFLPAQAEGIVLFAHGSGSSRHSPRNKAVAEILNQANIATLLLDLLTIEEEESEQYTAELRFDINLLAERLLGATEWVKANPATHTLKQGYFGASTGAAAALVAAAQLPSAISAIVSRGGRPDLAGQALTKVKAPTLFIVGGNDDIVIELNQQAQQKLTATNKLEIIPGATHLFPEPGTLEQVAELAKRWFVHWFHES